MCLDSLINNSLGMAVFERPRKMVAYAQQSEDDLCNSGKLPLHIILSCDCQCHYRSGLESYPHAI